MGALAPLSRTVLALPQALGFRVLHGQCRDAVQHGLEGAENPFHGVVAGRLMAQFLKLFQRNHIFFAKRPDGSAPQPRHMPDRTQGLGQIAGERADIGTFAAGDSKFGMIGIGQAQQLDFLDENRPGSEVHSLARPGEIIGPLALDLDRRKCRRRLQNFAFEARQYRCRYPHARADGRKWPKSRPRGRPWSAPRPI